MLFFFTTKCNQYTHKLTSIQTLFSKNSQTWSFCKILKIVCLYLMILVRKFLMTKSLSSWLPQVDTRTLMSFMWNTTHIILFKSPRDVQQVEFLGKQLNLTHFLKNCYEIATRETFGHLLIDLDPKTSDCLRFCSNITEPGPSVFYIPSDKADITHISNEREKILYTEANGTFIWFWVEEISPHLRRQYCIGTVWMFLQRNQRTCKSSD